MGGQGGCPGGDVSQRKAYESAVMTCGCGDRRSIGEMHVTMKGLPPVDLPSPPAIVEVMCVDCVLSKGWDIDLTATMLSLTRHMAKARGTE